MARSIRQYKPLNRLNDNKKYEKESSEREK